MLRVCALSLLVFHFGNAESIATTSDNESEMEPSRSNETLIRTNSIGFELCANVDFNGCPVCTRKYMVGRQKVTLNSAVLLCNQIGMEIASPMSADEQKAIENTCYETEPDIKRLWIGGKRCSDCLSEFIWITSGKPVIYRYFWPKEPNNQGKNENCLELWRDTNDKFYKWNDLNCNELSSFVCQTKFCCNYN